MEDVFNTLTGRVRQATLPDYGVVQIDGSPAVRVNTQGGFATQRGLVTLKDPHNPGRLKGMDRSFTDFEKFYTPTSDELRVRHYWTWGRRPTPAERYYY